VIRRSSRVLIAGIVLLLLGLGNWAMGVNKVAQYKARQKEAIRMGGGAVTEPFRGTASILHEQTEAQDLYEEAVARYRYYKLVRRGGRFFMIIGALLATGALLRWYSVPIPSRPTSSS
jgi:hypothetical protein